VHSFSAAVRALVSEKRAEMARTLALRAEGDMAGAMSLVKGKTGVALMDGVRHLVGQMDAKQDLLVAAARRRFAKSVSSPGSAQRCRSSWWGSWRWRP